MDKSWMSNSRVSKEFELGVENFTRFGFSNTNSTSICCPCLKCENCQRHIANDIRDHLYFNALMKVIRFGLDRVKNFLVHSSMENPLSVFMKRIMLEI